MDLEPVRRLVVALVQTSGRHTAHWEDAPVMGVHACAQGKPGCPTCRYGYPLDRVPRGQGRRMHLVKGDKGGSWLARFPRNDRFCCCYNVGVLLANLGNIDFRPCLNLWAVVGYVTKCATKAPKGSQRFGEVLRVAVDQVCRYEPEHQGTDLLRRSLQKVFARTLGERDFGIFEAVHLGLRLPLVFPLMDVVTLNTMGVRALRPLRELRGAPGDAPLTYDSKVDTFDGRQRLLARGRRRDGVTVVDADELRYMSMFEFYWKFDVRRGQVARAKQQRCIMVTPGFGSNCAYVRDKLHGDYARVAVIAYWRLMPKAERHRQLRNYWGLGTSMDLSPGLCQDPLTWSDQDFPTPLGRFLGVQDLVRAFDGRRDAKGRDYGWSRAFMDILMDPLLLAFVPGWVREQYERWNPDFRSSIRYWLKRPAGGSRPRPSSHGELRSRVRARMVSIQDRRRREREAAEDAGQELVDSDDDGSSAGSGGSGDEDPQVAAERLREGQEMVQDPEPTLDGVEAAAGGDAWARATAEQQLSAAPPAPAAPDTSYTGGVPEGACLYLGEVAVNPPGYAWVSAVSVHECTCAKALVDERFGTDIEAQGDGGLRADLDVWGRFAYDIVDLHAAFLPDGVCCAARARGACLCA